MIAIPYPPGFIASIEDTSCAAPVGDAEYSQLITRLDNVVMPALRQATVELQAAGFKPSQVARDAGLASVVVQRDDPAANAWLYFQIHRSLGLGPESECVFWMYAIHHPAGTTASIPGRLAHLEEAEAVEGIVTAFVQACAEAPRQRKFAAPAPPQAGFPGKELTRPAGRPGRGVFASA